VRLIVLTILNPLETKKMDAKLQARLDEAGIKRWTTPQYYFGETWHDYFVGLGRHRDSDVLERSNFDNALKMLGGETETVLTVCENHFLVGWVEWIAVHESDTEALEQLIEIAERLEDYPILDEEAFSEEENEEALEVWQNCYNDRERIEYIRDHKFQFEFRDFAELRDCVRGDSFLGYASDLIN
jgi:hypothetical protein